MFIHACIHLMETFLSTSTFLILRWIQTVVQIYRTSPQVCPGHGLDVCSGRLASFGSPEPELPLNRVLFPEEVSKPSVACISKTRANAEALDLVTPDKASKPLAASNAARLAEKARAKASKALNVPSEPSHASSKVPSEPSHANSRVASERTPDLAILVDGNQAFWILTRRRRLS